MGDGAGVAGRPREDAGVGQSEGGRWRGWLSERGGGRGGPSKRGRGRAGRSRGAGVVGGTPQAWPAAPGRMPAWLAVPGRGWWCAAWLGQRGGRSWRFPERGRPRPSVPAHRPRSPGLPLSAETPRGPFSQTRKPSLLQEGAVFAAYNSKTAPSRLANGSSRARAPLARRGDRNLRRDVARHQGFDVDRHLRRHEVVRHQRHAAAAMVQPAANLSALAAQTTPHTTTPSLGRPPTAESHHQPNRAPSHHPSPALPAYGPIRSPL